MSGILQLINTFPSGGFAVKNSLRFRSSASAYLNRTPSVGGNQQTWTWSGWVKRGTLGVTNYIFCARTALGTSSGTIFTGLNFTSSDTLNFRNYIYGTGEDVTVTTSQVFRDPSAWYHIALALDTTQGSSSNRVRMYVNGVQVTAFSAATYPSQNEQLAINYPFAHQLARQTDSAGTGSDFYDGYWSEINFIDGQALTPSSFGAFDATSGVWQPVKYSGTYGTNGFYLKFSDTTSTTTLCYDYSGNGNNWTPNNISLTAGSTYDSMLDSPTNYDNGGNGVGNYAVMNPLDIGSASSLNSGNLNFTSSSANGLWYQSLIFSNFAVSSGKWYWEISPVTIEGIYGISTGICNPSASPSFGTGLSPSYSYTGYDGSKNNNGTVSSYGATWGAGDIIGVALDLTSGQLTYYKNGVSQGVAATGVSGSFIAFVSTYESGRTHTGWFNFGQRPFAYTPPSGYKALNTQNLPAASIVNGASYMAATTYTGNGSTQNVINAVNGVSFQPDFVWVKSRSNAYDNCLFDSVRSAGKQLVSNSTSAEANYPQSLTAFNLGGFSLGSDAALNGGSSTFVGWQWKAGGTAVTNNAGSITSQVSANTTAGFSVVTYTGNGNVSATVGHGLGVAPAMVIEKGRSDGTYSWRVYHQSLSAGNMLLLNSTSGALAINSDGGISSVGSSTFGFSGGTPAVNANGATYVAYCFAAIPGYSAFGSYTGNGSSDGPFVFTGFRPRYVLIKRTDSSVGGSWFIHDTSRSTYNVISNELCSNLSDAEFTYQPIDILSNGFKVRINDASWNAAGGTYIYAAFAENPFKYSLAR